MAKFVIEGLGPNGDYLPEGQGAPFMLFCPTIQDWLPGKYAARHVAESLRVLYENLITYYAVEGLGGHVNLYRLSHDAADRIADPPIANFASVADFEAFTGKSLKEFNQVG